MLFRSSQQIAEFFHGAGILILEGYGLTESSAATCVNHPKDFRFGSVGRPVPGVEVKIAEDDGEILLGGRGVMRGYHNLPDETHASLDGGWLKTGDIGQVDDDGFLRITDRKKDLIKTSGGKYIAPQRLEGRLKTLCPYIAHVLVHGDRRNFCSALITLDTESISKWARDRGGTQMDPLSLVESDAVQKMVDDAVNDLNSELASYETIKRFKILPKEFTLEDGELTPSMKLKRKVVEERHREVLDGFYDGAISRI